METAERQCAKNSNNLKEFIIKYKHLPELWDPTDQNYSKKYKRLSAYKELLEILKKIKSNATVEDVRKKINIIRSNYKKVWRKIYASSNTYKSSSWQFYELSFLNKLEKRNETKQPTFKFKVENIEETPISNDVWEIHDSSSAYNGNESVESQYPMEDESESNIAESPNVENRQLCESYSPENQCLENHDYELAVAKVWAAKLKLLSPEHKLYTEKTINDILFEANLKSLNRPFKI